MFSLEFLNEWAALCKGELNVSTDLLWLYGYLYMWWHIFVERCGTLVESKSFDRRVVGSNPALAATLASP